VSAQSSSLLGYGLYFIDVLACLLFCITLALVGARFGREQTVAVELPELARSEGTGSDLSGATITLRAEGDALEIFLDDERVGFDELAERLTSEQRPSVVVRSEESSLTRVIGIAHAAGVHDIQLAYEVAGDGEGAAPAGGRRER
jgi:biopolymer transport protein ExbD